MKIITMKKSRQLAVTATICCMTLLASNSSAVAASGYEKRAEVKQFIDEMVSKHGFDKTYLQNRFAKVETLDNILESIAKPAEKELTWKQYRPIFVTNKRTNKGKTFMREYRDVLQRAEDKYGVPTEIIAAIIGVETYYGGHTGKYTVFDSLTTLAFDYPPRSKFFKKELKEFLLLSKEEHISVDDMTGSYAGAMGMPQFISSSYRHYAVDFDGDGKRDLWNSVPDVIGSVANYFGEHGWKRGGGITYPVKLTDTSIVKKKNKLKPYVSVANLKQQGVIINADVSEAEDVTLLKFEGKRGDEYWIGLDNYYVITRYNHSDMYAMAVYQLSERLK